jgi:threonine/homoserine/homoserine lactone efflux protein
MNMLLAFVTVSIVVIVTPGPDTAITIRNTLFGGRAAGLFTAIGIVSGQMVWALAASIGIVAVLKASEPLFLTIRYAGAVYLIFLGLVALKAAIRPAVVADVAARPPASSRGIAPPVAFRQGFASDLGNPKMAVFFASLLPQFVPYGAQAFSALLLRGLIFAAMTFAWLAFYAILIAWIGDTLRRPHIRRLMEAATGTVLVGFGLRIAAERP